MRGSGIDIVHIPSFAKLAANPRAAFVLDHFTPAEIEYSELAAGETVTHLAARYAAKEAAIKAMEETQLFRPKNLLVLNYRDIEVAKDPHGRPYLLFHGPLAQFMESLQATAFLSLSHDGDYAIAQVLLS